MSLAKGHEFSTQSCQITSPIHQDDEAWQVLFGCGQLGGGAVHRNCVVLMMPRKNPEREATNGGTLYATLRDSERRQHVSAPTCI